jgi:hypothetical protein
MAMPYSASNSLEMAEGRGGKREPRAPQAVRARMVGGTLGDFSQAFQWLVEGVAAPVRLELRGRVVPPAVKVRRRRV